MSARPRGAYVELNFNHGELFVSWASIAHDAGVDLDFHVLRENLRDRPFGASEHRPCVRSIDVDDPHDPCSDLDRLTERLLDGAYDFAIIGTAEPDDRIDFARRLPLPILLVVHNPDRRLPRVGNGRWVVLTPAAARLQREHDPLLIQPVGAGAEPLPPYAERDHAFAVVGTVQYARRNYGALLRALTGLKASGVSPASCQVRILGRWHEGMTHPGVVMALDGNRLLDQAERLGVREFIDVPERALDHDEIRRRLARCRYALPLVDEFYAPTRRYVAGKAAGGVNQAIGTLTIPVINERYARSLGLGAGHHHRLDDVESGLRGALQGGGDRMVAALQQYRDDALAHSSRGLRQWVDQL